MAESNRNNRVTPGISFSTTEIFTRAKSLGVTKLGIVGETVKGPAFQKIPIRDWGEYVNVFGDKNPAKFKGSKYPKYELPYIAQSYLTESNQVDVVRVLGLSGYNAGPAWVIKAMVKGDNPNNKYKDMAIAVLRSRGHYDKYHKVSTMANTCNCPTESYDTLVYDVGEIKTDNENCVGKVKYNMDVVRLAPYQDYDSLGNECEGYSLKTKDGVDTEYFPSSSTDLGRFKIEILTGAQTEGKSVRENEGYWSVFVSQLEDEFTFEDGDVYTYQLDGELNVYVFDAKKIYDEETIDSHKTELKEKFFGKTLDELASKLELCYRKTDSLTADCNLFVDDYDRFDNSVKEYVINENNISFRALSEFDENVVAHGSAYSDVYTCLYPNINKSYYRYNAGVKDENAATYSVSLNPGANDYILKVLGMSPDDGDAPLYVESLYDLALQQGIDSENIIGIKAELAKYNVCLKSDYCVLRPVADFLYTDENALTKKDVGKRFIADGEFTTTCHAFDYTTNKPIEQSETTTEDTPSVDKIEIEGTYFNIQSPDVLFVFYYPESAYTVSQVRDFLNEYISYLNADGYNDVTIDDIADQYGEVVTSTLMIDLTNVPVDKHLINEEDASAEHASIMERMYSPTPTPSEDNNVVLGQVYTVKQYTDKYGKRHYYYAYYKNISEESLDTTDRLIEADKLEREPNGDKYQATLVKVNADGKYYMIDPLTDSLSPVMCDLNDYKEPYRFASTPWFVSQIKGDATNYELNKLFRFHTISDGDNANREVKISITNIRPDEGLFDVLVRNINDTDESLKALESFQKCSMQEGTSNYIGYKIGTYDGVYESKSNYITVEVNESTAAKNSVPCGFLGYPVSNFGSLQINGIYGGARNPILKYNLDYDDDIKVQKQYFGLSSIVGVDVDAFTYKGHAAYAEDPDYICQGFHLDSRLDMDAYSEGDKPKFTVDGVEGYKFDVVSVSNRTATLDEAPIVSTEAEMQGSIYEKVNARKFTAYFYGGFDGWDVYREARSTDDDFKLNKYKGIYNNSNGIGRSLDRIGDYEAYGLTEDGLTSDFYAFLAGARQFANPNEIKINIFATPGIDLVNNHLLSQEIIDMLESERGNDALYVAITPDKPYGADDYFESIYKAEDIVNELENADYDTPIACTYYPWVKYEDTTNNQYIFLSPTKDVVRNLALTDNKSFPWFATAGYYRGNVDCVRTRYTMKKSDSDIVYASGLNPLMTFASDGVKIWGVKNLKKDDESQLSLVSVVRLVQYLQNEFEKVCLPMFFDPTDITQRNQVKTAVTNILTNVKNNRGLADMYVASDDSVEAADRGEINLTIAIAPTRPLEDINVNFVITPQSVKFSIL